MRFARGVGRRAILALVFALLPGADATPRSAEGVDEASSGLPPFPGVYTARVPASAAHDARVLAFVEQLDVLDATPGPDGSHWDLRFLRRAAGDLDPRATPPDDVDVAFDAAATRELRRHEPTREALAASASQGADDRIPGFPCYRNVAGTFALIDALVDRAASVAGLEADRLDLGDSYEKAAGLGTGHDVVALALTGRGAADRGWTTTKGVMYVICGIHAREYASPELCARWAEALVDGYGKDVQMTSLLDHTNIYIVLQANPDGRVIAEAHPELYWRKNTRPGCVFGDEKIGVDLNRNFPFQWGLDNGGSSRNPCGETYRGEGPLSETEAHAIANHMRAVFPAHQRKPDPEGQMDEAYPEDNVGVFVDIHSYGELVLWPWVHAERKTPNDEDLQAAARKMRHFNQYLLSGPETPDFLYRANGVTFDFAYGELGVCGLGYELGTAFYQDCASFDATIAPRNIPSLTYLAGISAKPFALAKGPDVIDFRISVGGDLVTITVTASDDALSDGPADGFAPSAQSVARVALTFDMHPADKRNGAAPLVLELPVSSNTGTVGTTASYAAACLVPFFATAPAGYHVVHAWAQDSAGYEGPVSATSFTLPNNPIGTCPTPLMSPTPSPTTTLSVSPSQSPSNPSCTSIGKGGKSKPCSKGKSAKSKVIKSKVSKAPQSGDTGRGTRDAANPFR